MGLNRGMKQALFIKLLNNKHLIEIFGGSCEIRTHGGR